MKPFWLIVLFFAVFVLFSSMGYSRPQYATQHRITQCTACHIDPGGGGIRNLYGKNYGAHGHPASVFSQKDWYYADWRLLYYSPENSETRSGMGLMEALFGLNLPLLQGGPDSQEVRFVFNHVLSGFQNDRDTYLRFQKAGDPRISWDPNYYLVGRIHLPFGYRTDDHRTYTRIATQSTWNHFFVGAMASGNPAEAWHYDWAITNSEPSSNPGNLTPGKANSFGTSLNLRWLSPFANFPVLIGISASHFDRTQDGPSGSAQSLYSVVSLSRWSQGKLPVSLAAEITHASGMNFNNADLSRLVTNHDYLSSVELTKSLAYLFEAEYWLNRHWVLVYKYDELWLDKNYPADAYKRYAMELRNYFASNMFWRVRFEQAVASHPSESTQQAKTGAQDAFFAILQVAF